MSLYAKQQCTNCGYEFPINGNPEFEYLLNNSHSILLCKKCSIPINAFFGNIEKLGIKCNSIYDAMVISEDYHKCFVCHSPASKNYFRKKKRRYIKICDSCNKILEIYLTQIIQNGGRLRNFSFYTDKLNNMITAILRGGTAK